MCLKKWICFLSMCVVSKSLSFFCLKNSSTSPWNRYGPSRLEEGCFLACYGSFKLQHLGGFANKTPENSKKTKFTVEIRRKKNIESLNDSCSFFPSDVFGNTKGGVFRQGSAYWPSLWPSRAPEMHPSEIVGCRAKTQCVLTKTRGGQKK